MKVLVVCLGNICRSPIAEGVLRQYAPANWQIDSAGTNGYHNGENPDKRAIAVCKQHGVDISGLRSRKFTKADFNEFDKIWVMDSQNLRDVLQMATNETEKQKVSLFIPDTDVADPWYDTKLFEPVFSQLQQRAIEIAKKYQ